MRSRPGRNWQRRWGVPALAAALLAGPLVEARANHTGYTVAENKLGYSACTWPAGKVLSVAVDPAFPLPDPTYTDRLDEAVARWNAVLATSNRGGGMSRVADGPADVVVQYRQTDTTLDHGVLAETFLQRDTDAELSPDSSRCPDRQPASMTMKAAQILINPRDDWYTGADSQVNMWQMCDDERFRAANAGLCADQVDFASTIVHELGHTLVLYHPQTLDQADGTAVEAPDSASAAARCVESTGSFPNQATLCSGQGVWRAEQRDLETWDIETIHRHNS